MSFLLTLQCNKMQCIVYTSLHSLKFAKRRLVSIFRPSFEWTICCFSARRKKHHSWLACWWWWCHASQMGPVDPHTLVPNWATKEWRLMLYGCHSILKSKKAQYGGIHLYLVNINFLLFQSTIPAYSTKYLSTTYLSMNMELECTTKMIIIALCIWGGFVP